jgi:tetratricopeptide (TPR) repeat protein
MFRNALEACREGLGATHPDTLTARRGLALVALARGAQAEAAALLEEGLSLLAADHPQKLDLDYALAIVYHARGESARALTLLQGILRVNEKTYGENHEAQIPVLTDLAQVHSGLGCWLEARELLERIRSIRGRSPFPDPLGQSIDLVNLADSYRQVNDTERASDLAQQALDTARSRLKPGDPRLVGYLTHFARTCQARRAFSAARRRFQEALDMVRQYGGSRHPLVAGLWIDLANLEVSREKPRRATKLYIQAADLLQTVLGEDHPDHAAARRTLGLHLQALGDFAGVESAIRAYLNIVRRSCGTGHPAVAIAYHFLSGLQRQSGDLAGATESCRQALDLVRKCETPSDAVHAGLLHMLAVLNRQQGQMQEARNLLNQALEIDRESICEEGMPHLDSLSELALIEAAQGKDAGALKRFHRVLSFQDELTGVFAYLPPGRGRDAWLVAPWHLVESILTLSLRLPDPADSALGAVLRWKAFGTADMVPGDRAALRRRRPTLARELDRLFDLSMQIASRLIRGAGLDGLQLHHDLLRRWGEERQGLEKKLADAVPELARLRAVRSVDVPALRRTLPVNTSFIELVRFQPRDFTEMCAGRDGMLPPRYLAFVLQAGDAKVIMRDLGPAADLERRVGTELLRNALSEHLASGRQLLVACDGRLDRTACARIFGQERSVRTVCSGREIVSPLLARRKGWLDWLVRRER